MAVDCVAVEQSEKRVIISRYYTNLKKNTYILS